MASVTGLKRMTILVRPKVSFAEAKNLVRLVRNDRPGKGAGTPERNQSMSDEVLSVLSPSRRLALVRADSGNVRESRMTL